MIGALAAVGIAVGLVWAGKNSASGFRAGNHKSVDRFPKGHIREYDPDGIYTYKDQNPRFR